MTTDSRSRNPPNPDWVLSAPCRLDHRFSSDRRPRNGRFGGSPFNGRPARSQTVVGSSDIRQDMIQEIHGGRGKVVASRVAGRVRHNLLLRQNVVVDRRDVVVFRCSRVEDSQSLHGHGVNGMSHCFVEVVRQLKLTIDLGAGRRGARQENHCQKTHLVFLSLFRANFFGNRKKGHFTNGG